MTNKEIIDLYEGLEEISQDKTQIFDINIGYVLAKNKNLLAPYYDAAITSRNRLILKYGSQQEDGSITIPKDKVPIFSQELESFLGMENFVVLEQIQLKEIQNTRLSIQLIGQLLPIIKKDAT